MGKNRKALGIDCEICEKPIIGFTHVVTDGVTMCVDCHMERYTDHQAVTRVREMKLVRLSEIVGKRYFSCGYVAVMVNEAARAACEKAVRAAIADIPEETMIDGMSYSEYRARYNKEFASKEEEYAAKTGVKGATCEPLHMKKIDKTCWMVYCAYCHWTPGIGAACNTLVCPQCGQQRPMRIVSWNKNEATRYGE